VKRILTSGLVGTASALAALVARSPSWVVLLGVLALVLVVFAALRTFLIALRLTHRLFQQLAERPQAGSFKGSWRVGPIEVKACSEPASPKLEPPRPKPTGRRKPSLDS
jgi:hypothetical protein